MRFLLALLLAAAPLSPALAQNVEPTTAERLETLTAVMRAIQQGKAAEAIELVDPLLEDYEKFYAGETRAIFCAIDSEEERLYEETPLPAGKTDYVVVEGGWCMALWAKGYALVELDRYADALPYLERAVAMSPWRSNYLSELGNTYQHFKRYEQALGIFTRAAEAAQRLKSGRWQVHLGRAWRGMGFNLIELGRWDEAEAMFNKALELDPDDARAKNELEYIARHRPKK